MIFFIADTHFGHQTIIDSCDRPYTCVKEMDESIISNWNKYVTGDDTVYVLGDMFYRCTNPKKILCRLKGKKRLIIGNHDASWMSEVLLSNYFESVDFKRIVLLEEYELTLCHEPDLQWKKSKYAYMIYGHIHNRTDLYYWPLLCQCNHYLNAGVDINAFRPVTFEEMVINNQEFKKVHCVGMK